MKDFTFCLSIATAIVLVVYMGIYGGRINRLQRLVETQPIVQVPLKESIQDLYWKLSSCDTAVITKNGTSTMLINCYYRK